MSKSIIRSLVLPVLALSLGVQVGFAQSNPTRTHLVERPSNTQPVQRDLTIPEAFELVANAAAEAQRTSNQPDPKQLEALYHTVWQTVANRYYDVTRLANWRSWEHKFDGTLATTDDLDAAVSDLVASLNDRWTSYRSPSAQKLAKEKEAKGVVWLGVWLNGESDGNYRVVYVEAFSPAYHSPLRKGDVINEIDGHPLRGLRPREVDQLLEGNIGSQKLVVFSHNGIVDNTSVSMFKEVTPPSEVRMLAGDILYARLPEFQQPAVDSFDRQIDEVLENDHNINGIILDLRGNPGGLVELAKHVASTFVGYGNVILRIQERNGLMIDEQTARSLSIQPYMLDDASKLFLRRMSILHNKPMIVLVDGTSASSAEIVTAALEDSHRALVMGEQSWGKAVAWQETTLTNGGVLRFTSGAITAPAGYSWRDVGLKPNIVVVQPRRTSVDVQLIASTDKMREMIQSKRGR